MKRAIPTPNRFIISTPNWWGKSAAFFLFLTLLGGCLDDSSLIGIKKESPRLGVHFKEFSLPATTVQTDSVRTQNQYFGSGTTDIDRLLIGKVVDPNFGETTAALFAGFLPTGKISGRSQVAIERLTMTLALDYYVYGDTNTSDISFAVHEITDPNFKSTSDYFAHTSVQIDPTPLATATFTYKRDSILKSRQRNTDASTTNNRVDTLFIDLPIETIGQLLLDTALRKGMYVKNSSGTYVFSTNKTDSVFQSRFKGLAVLPITSNKIIGIKTSGAGSWLTLYYSYSDGGVIKHDRFYYGFPIGYVPNFTQISNSRQGTPLQTLATNHSDFNAPDDYCYLQSGTGAFTKLDLTEVYQFFGEFPNLAVNSAELIVPLEPTTTKSHMKEPTALFTRILRKQGDSIRFFRANATNGAAYQSYYYSRVNYEYFLDAQGDAGGLFTLNYVSATDGRYYRGHLSDFLQVQLRNPASIEKVNIGLIPTNAPYGKSFEGVSFKKDKIKLKVYYTTP